MEAPVFEEFDPAGGCDCPGCVHWRRVAPFSLPVRGGGHPASRAAHRTLALAAAAGTALAAGQALPAAAAHAPVLPGADAAGESAAPRGAAAPLQVSATAATRAKFPETTRAEIIKRAKKWVAARVPYDMDKYWSDGYRQDCSGFISMAWNLGTNQWTGSLAAYGERITKEELQPGDMLLFHNSADPQKGSHVVIFGGWTDYTHKSYTAYEQARPHARKQATPYAYWSNSARYVPYRYKGLAPSSGGSGGQTATAFPGRKYFGPGADNKYVTQLGRMLVERGAGGHYRSGPGPRWTDADRRATRAFQLAQGWTGADADGLPGPATWSYLVKGKGKDVKGGSDTSGGSASHGVPAFPGRGLFRPGAENRYVTLLGERLVKKGFGRHYEEGPGPRWTEADRRNVEAFQRAQGWRGGAADGYPGPETWRRLFT